MTDPIILPSVQLDPEIHAKIAHISDKDSQKLRETCSQMESLFLYELLKEMRATVPKEGLFSGGKAEEMYSSVLDLKLAEEIASKREIGISSMLFKQLSSNAVNPKDKSE